MVVYDQNHEHRNCSSREARVPRKGIGIWRHSGSSRKLNLTDNKDAFGNEVMQMTKLRSADGARSGGGDTTDDDHDILGRGIFLCFDFCYVSIVELFYFLV